MKEHHSTKVSVKKNIGRSDIFNPNIISFAETKCVNALIVGQCIFQGWSPIILKEFPDVQLQSEYFNNAVDLSVRDCSKLDFQVLSVPLRSVLPEGMYMRLDYADIKSHKDNFDACCRRIDFALHSIMKYNRESGLTTFVGNFFTPIANPMGRLLPRYDLRNPVYFIEELNRYLSDRLATFNSAHVLDLNQISAMMGKKFVQDDAISALSHNAIMADHALQWDAQRLQPPNTSIRELFNTDEREFVVAAWRELLAMYRTIGGIDSVKMVIMDLDDTLWRGIAGDVGGVDQMEQAEGWPLGVAEALTFLRKRGIMLAIASKNEESYIRKIWPYTGRLDMDDFAFIRINWNPKSDNIADIIRLANILPSSVVFVDDNPVEREAVSAEIPGIRTLGSNPYLIRSALLWSSETQVAFITDESARRTTMMQAQERRDVARVSMSRGDFLRGQDITLSVVQTDVTDNRFMRAFELLNKTNQFNTTGKRWREREIRDAVAHGLGVFTFNVTDKFIDYGLVGVILLHGYRVDQFVMSCRVLGMDVELGALAVLSNAMLQSAGKELCTTALLIENDRNFPCVDIYSRAGYVRDENVWSKSIAQSVDAPRHITII